LEKKRAPWFAFGCDGRSNLKRKENILETGKKIAATEIPRRVEGTLH